MHPKLEKALGRWLAAGLLDYAAAERIRTYESEQDKSTGMRWPVLLAISLGGLLVAAGVLLFVAAHWDELSPSARFTLVLLMVGMFHAGGAFAAERFAALASVLHAVGTVTLGAGISLAGQIFNLAEHWPGGVMLWAAGAWVAWWLLRAWPQAALVAILTPAWLVGEWRVATEHYRGGGHLASQWLLILAFTYLSARIKDQPDFTRRALTWMGALAVLPLAALVIEPWGFFYRRSPVPGQLQAIGWTVGVGLPLALAWFLRGRAAWMNAISAVWVILLGTIESRWQRVDSSLLAFVWNELGLYVWCGLGSIGMVAWGLKELRRERVNLGVAAFGITVLAFYFSSVMDKLGRSTSLIGLGIIFLMGGWALERARRHLIARMQAGGSA